MAKNNFVNKITQITFIIFSVLIFFTRACTFLSYFQFNLVLQTTFLLLLITICYLIVKYKKILQNLLAKLYIRVNKLSYRKMAFILMFTSLATKLLFFLIFRIDPTKHPDISRYWSFIKQLNENEFITEDVVYARKFSYTVIFSSLYVPIAKIFGTSSFYPYVIFNILLLTVAVYLLFSTVTYLKNKNISFISTIIWVLLPAGIMQPSMLVHENSLIFIHCLCFFLYFKLFKILNNKLYKFIVLAIVLFLLSFEFIINQFALVAIIAILIDFFVSNYKVIYKLATIAMVILSLISVNNFKNDYIDKHVMQYEVNKSSYIPYGWTFYAGLNYETGGRFSNEDWDIWREYDETLDEDLITSYEKKLISQRLSEYLDSPFKILKHLNDKMSIIWSDYNPAGYRDENGTCYGNSICQAFNDSKLDTVVYIAMAFINCLLSYIILVLCVKNIKNIDDGYICYSKMFIIGVNTILLFIEVMPKYSSHLVAFYLLIFGNLLTKNLKNLNN